MKWSCKKKNDATWNRNTINPNQFDFESTSFNWSCTNSATQAALEISSARIKRAVRGVHGTHVRPRGTWAAQKLPHGGFWEWEIPKSPKVSIIKSGKLCRLTWMIWGPSLANLHVSRHIQEPYVTWVCNSAVNLQLWRFMGMPFKHQSVCEFKHV